MPAAVDIAYKPASSGWGYTKKYSSGWDRIFAKKNSSSAESHAEHAEQRGTDSGNREQQNVEAARS
jgi:hypothetical protein